MLGALQIKAYPGEEGWAWHSDLDLASGHSCLKLMSGHGPILSGMISLFWNCGLHASVKHRHRHDIN